MKSRKQKIKEMRESMDKLEKEYDVKAIKETAAERKRKDQIRKRKAKTDRNAPFSAIGLGKKIIRRGKQLKKATQE